MNGNRKRMAKGASAEFAVSFTAACLIYEDILLFTFQSEALRFPSTI